MSLKMSVHTSVLFKSCGWGINGGPIATIEELAVHDRPRRTSDDAMPTEGHMTQLGLGSAIVIESTIELKGGWGCLEEHI
jgi:hypothetical protein